MTTLTRSMTVVALLIVFVPGAAFAQLSPEPPVFDQGFESPGLPFIGIDRQDSRSAVGVDVAYVKLEGLDFPDAVYRLEIHGQFLISQTAQNYMGGYGAIPLSYVSAEGLDDQFGIGGAEIGGFYGIRQGSSELVIRGGLTLPTGDDDEGVIGNLIAGLARLTDLAQVVPRTSVLRVSASWLGQSDQLFYRFDGGLDFPLVEFADDFEIDREPLIRLNAGIGIGTPTAAGVFELINLIDSGTLDDDLGDAALHVLGIAFRGTGGTLAYHAGVYFPIDDPFSSLIDLIVSVGVSGGI